MGSYLLKHGRFDENVTKSFTHQILDGLHYLHSKKILHGVRSSPSTVYSLTLRIGSKIKQCTGGYVRVMQDF